MATTQILTYAGTPAASRPLGDVSGRKYLAQQFTATADGIVTSVKWYQRTVDGSPVDGIVVEIWTDNSGVPGSLISGVTQTIAAGSIVDGANSFSTAEFTLVTFGTAAQVVNATKYWVVSYRAGSFDAVNYRDPWLTDPSSYSSGLFATGTSVPAWTVQDQDQALEVTIATLNITEVSGAPVEAISLLYQLAVADVSGAPVEGDREILIPVPVTKNNSIWTNTQKSS